MKTPKFTPGPWNAVRIEQTLSMNGICHGEVNGPKGIVCNTEESTAEETMANARLIAAAPEMFEIIKAYLNFLKTAAHTDGEVATYHYIESLIERINGGAE